MIVVSVITRRLREGKTYDDFRAAWLPDVGFDVPTRVVSAQRVDDDREIVTIGFSEMTEEQAEAALKQLGRGAAAADPQAGGGKGFSEEVVREQQARHERINEVIDPEMTQVFYVQVGDDDLT